MPDIETLIIEAADRLDLTYAKDFNGRAYALMDVDWIGYFDTLDEVIEYLGISSEEIDKMSREETIRKLDFFCKNQENCSNIYGQPMCPLYHYEWDCDFHVLSESELTKAYNDVFGIKIAIPTDATNGDVVKMLFPNSELHKESNYVLLNICKGVYLEDRNADWWNAPYKA